MVSTKIFCFIEFDVDLIPPLFKPKQIKIWPSRNHNYFAIRNTDRIIKRSRHWYSSPNLGNLGSGIKSIYQNFIIQIIFFKILCCMRNSSLYYVCNSNDWGYVLLFRRSVESLNQNLVGIRIYPEIFQFSLN